MSQSDDFSLAGIQKVITTLLAPGGCPWDRKQTVKSLCDYIIEEAFELVTAIRKDDAEGTCEEMGDVLFLLAFEAVLHERAGKFTLADVVKENADKMIRRHPHVFGNTVVHSQEELLSNWERIKREEHAAKEKNGRPAGTFDSLPEALPPLLKAYRLHSKAARLGFTWETEADILDQLASERREWNEACASGSQERMEEEYGDMLFTVVELGRRHGIKANAALEGSNLKFLRRYERMEALARERGLDLVDLPLEEKNRLWDEAKKG